MKKKFRRLSIKERLEAISDVVKLTLPLETDENINDIFNSIFRNRSLDADTFRPYAAGDDFETVNVKQSIKRGADSLLAGSKPDDFIRDIVMGNYYVARSTEEKRSCLYFILDLSDSLLYGINRDYDNNSIFTTRIYIFYKLFYCLYNYALANNFNVGSLICGKEREVVKAASARANLNISGEKLNKALLRVWERRKTGRKRGREGLIKAIGDVQKNLRYRGLIVVISDFNYTKKQHKEITAKMGTVGRQHYILPFQVGDELELDNRVLNDRRIEKTGVAVPIDKNGEYLNFIGRGKALYKKREEIGRRRKKLLEEARLLPFEQCAGADIDKEFRNNFKNYFSRYVNMAGFIKPM